MPSLEDIQRALQRCLAAEPPQASRLSADASALATVYAEMNYFRTAERRLEGLPEKQRDAFLRWAEPQQ
ncbi:DUF3717 domain-containing protein [Niveibacterium sp. SC-1]|uniref:DUF3717 domain-containing protein n=1 Tax=Niveibacterium sp. SC-1 TaxID=3135646 RepID=UPI00311DF342